MRDTRTEQAIAEKIVNDITAGGNTEVFYDNVWGRVQHEVGRETRKSQKRFAVSDLVYKGLRAQGIRVHS